MKIQYTDPSNPSFVGSNFLKESFDFHLASFLVKNIGSCLSKIVSAKTLLLKTNSSIQLKIDAQTLEPLGSKRGTVSLNSLYSALSFPRFVLIAKEFATTRGLLNHRKIAWIKLDKTIDKVPYFVKARRK